MFGRALRSFKYHGAVRERIGLIVRLERKLRKGGSATQRPRVGENMQRGLEKLF